MSSSVSGASLDAAIIAYVGKGRVKIPTADEAAVRALDPVGGDALLERVQEAVRISDTIPLSEVGPFDQGLRARLYARLREVLPELGEAGVEALGWRWGYVQFG
jgi:hypothetical protein